MPTFVLKLMGRGTSGKIRYINASNLYLHSSTAVYDVIGDDMYLSYATHDFHTYGTSSSFSLYSGPPIIIPAGDIPLNELKTNKWISETDYDNIDYGKADVIVYFTTPAGPSLPIPWPSPLLDNDVEAPDQLGQ